MKVQWCKPRDKKQLGAVSAKGHRLWTCDSSASTHTNSILFRMTSLTLISPCACVCMCGHTRLHPVRTGLKIQRQRQCGDMLTWRCWKRQSLYVCMRVLLSLQRCPHFVCVNKYVIREVVRLVLTWDYTAATFLCTSYMSLVKLTFHRHWASWRLGVKCMRDELQ